MLSKKETEMTEQMPIKQDELSREEEIESLSGNVPEDDEDDKDDDEEIERSGLEQDPMRMASVQQITRLLATTSGHTTSTLEEEEKVI